MPDDQRAAFEPDKALLIFVLVGSNVHRNNAYPRTAAACKVPKPNLLTIFIHDVVEPGDPSGRCFLGAEFLSSPRIPTAPSTDFNFVSRGHHI